MPVTASRLLLRKCPSVLDYINLTLGWAHNLLSGL